MPAGSSTKTERPRQKMSRLLTELREEILSGRMKPGQRLPTQIELSNRHTVAQATAAGAINQLVHEGLVVRISGNGSFVAEKLPPKRQILDFIRMRRPPGEAVKQNTLDWIEWLTEAAQEAGRVPQWHHLTYEEVEEMEKVVERFADSNGIIIYGPVPPDLLSLLCQHDIPLITVDTASSDSPATFHPQITFDRREACRKATEHLISLGYSRIGFVRIEPPIREAGFLDAMINHGLALRPDWLLYLGSDINYVDDKHHQLCVQLCTKLLTSHDRPEAMVCPTIHIAHALELTALKLGLKVPQDLAIIKGGPESSSIFGTVPVAVTGVGPSVQQTCQKALAVVEELASAPKTPGRHLYELILMPVHLTIRDSCGVRLREERLNSEVGSRK